MQHAGRKGLYQRTHVHLKVGRKAWYWGRLLRHNGQRYLRGSGRHKARGLGAWAARGGTRPGGWELGTMPEGGASAMLVVMDLHE
jgi:hypothetical protein